MQRESGLEFDRVGSLGYDRSRQRGVCSTYYGCDMMHCVRCGVGSIEKGDEPAR